MTLVTQSPASDANILALVEQGLSDADIAAKLGLSEQTVFDRRADHIVFSHRKPRVKTLTISGGAKAEKEAEGPSDIHLAPETALMLKNFVAQGLSDGVIGAKFGVSAKTAAKWITAAGLERGSAAPVAEPSPAPEPEPPTPTAPAPPHEIEWYRRQYRSHGRKSDPVIRIRRRTITLSKAACELMGNPERVSAGWDGIGLRLLLKPGSDGDFKLTHGGKASTPLNKFGGAAIVAWIESHGMAQGQYSVTWDGQYLVTVAAGRKGE